MKLEACTSISQTRVHPKNHGADVCNEVDASTLFRSLDISGAEPPIWRESSAGPLSLPLCLALCLPPSTLPLSCALSLSLPLSHCFYRGSLAVFLSIWRAASRRRDSCCHSQPVGSSVHTDCTRSETYDDSTSPLNSNSKQLPPLAEKQITAAFVLWSRLES